MSSLFIDKCSKIKVIQYFNYELSVKKSPNLYFNFVLCVNFAARIKQNAKQRVSKK